MVPLPTLSTVSARTQMDAKNKALLIAEAFLRDVNMPCINVSYFLTWIEHTWVTQLHPPKSPHLYRKIPPPLSHTQPDQEVVTKAWTCWFYHHDSKVLSPHWKKKLLHIIAQCSAEPPSTITTGGCFYRWLCAQDRPSPKKQGISLRFKLSFITKQ